MKIHCDKVWFKAMQIGAYTGCHQMAERSFSVGSYQFPVCARCTGVSIGYMIMIVQLFFTPPKLSFCIAGLGVMFLDWVLQYAKIACSNNIRRVISGIGGGYGIVGFYYFMFIAVKRMLF